MSEKTPGMRVIQPGPEQFKTGPAEGEPLPDFSLPSHEGPVIQFTRHRADRPALVHFFRSVEW